VTVFIIGWILLLAYIAASQESLDGVQIWVQFVWGEASLLGITVGAFWMLYNW